MTAVAVYSYTHSVTYIADNILKSLKDVIRLSGLNPTNLVQRWDSNLLALKTWLSSGDLEKVVLEVFDPANDQLIGRWDIDVAYGSSGDGTFWTDTEQIEYHIRKAGVWPSQAAYRLLMHTKPGRPDVPGWGSAEYRPIEGFSRHSLGATIAHNGLAGSAAYWRRTT